MLFEAGPRRPVRRRPRGDRLRRRSAGRASRPAGRTSTPSAPARPPRPRRSPAPTPRTSTTGTSRRPARVGGRPIRRVRWSGPAMRRSTVTERAPAGHGALADTPPPRPAADAAPRDPPGCSSPLVAARRGCSAAWYAVHQEMPAWYARLWYPLEYEDAINEEAAPAGPRPRPRRGGRRTPRAASLPDSRSSQGAVGLMQLLPETAALRGGAAGPPEPVARTGSRTRRSTSPTAPATCATSSSATARCRWPSPPTTAGETNVPEWLDEADVRGESLDIPARHPVHRDARRSSTRVLDTAPIYRRAYGDRLGPPPGSVSRQVALLRGVNVGTAHRVPMAALRELAGELGATEVATHLRSGNVVYGDAGPPGADGRATDAGAGGGASASRSRWWSGRRRRCGGSWRQPARRRGRGGTGAPAGGLPVGAARRAGALDGLEDEDVGDDAIRVAGREVYVWSAGGITGSRALAALERRRLPVTATARNWRTVETAPVDARRLTGEGRAPLPGACDDHGEAVNPSGAPRASAEVVRWR